MTMRTTKREYIDAMLIFLGIFLTGLGLKGFLMSSHFIDGGVIGISMLLSRVLGIQLPFLILLINLPFIALWNRQPDKKFALKSILAIAGLAICIAVVHFPNVTSDKLLTAVFGGFFIGAGMGLVIRGGAVLDGTEIFAERISKFSRRLKVGNVILIINIVVFTAAVLALGVEPALYSVLTFLATSMATYSMIHGGDEYTAVIIVSKKGDEIRRNIANGLNHDVTIYEGGQVFSGEGQDILHCVVTRLEMILLKRQL
jgi:uncharacterized membrane-anchored protein YitT (DUF2179 family)